MALADAFNTALNRLVQLCAPRGRRFIQRRAQPWKTDNRATRLFRPNGPTVRLEVLARWAEREILGTVLYQGCALRWVRGWAFGPNTENHRITDPLCGPGTATFAG